MSSDVHEPRIVMVYEMKEEEHQQQEKGECGMDSLVPGQQEQRSDHKHAQADYDWSGPGLRRQCQHESGTDMLERQEVRPIETLRGAGTPCRHIVRKCHWLVELIPQPGGVGHQACKTDRHPEKRLPEMWPCKVQAKSIIPMMPP